MTLLPAKWSVLQRSNASGGETRDHRERGRLSRQQRTLLTALIALKILNLTMNLCYLDLFICKRKDNSLSSTLYYIRSADICYDIIDQQNEITCRENIDFLCLK